MDISAERLNERDFVRKFGSKVKQVRYSGRIDFVGLIVCVANTGFWITKTDDGLRKCRLMDIIDGKIRVTPRYLPLKNNESMSNLWRGLLRYVQ